MASILDAFPNGAVGLIGWLDVCRVGMRIILIRSLFVGRIWIPKGRELCCACEKREAKKEMTDSVKHLASKGVRSSPIPTVDQLERKHHRIGGA